MDAQISIRMLMNDDNVHLEIMDDKNEITTNISLPSDQTRKLAKSLLDIADLVDRKRGLRPNSRPMPQA